MAVGVREATGDVPIAVASARVAVGLAVLIGGAGAVVEIDLAVLVTGAVAEAVGAGTVAPGVVEDVAVLVIESVG